MLKRIASRVDDRAGVISIEASDPVPYVASQPDPRTFVVEMRDVVAAGFADNFKADPRVPVCRCARRERARVRRRDRWRASASISSQPIRPRVRSSRNVIYVEADRLDRAGAGAISDAGLAGVIRDLQRARAAARRPRITLQGTGRLVTTSVEESKDGAGASVIDLANVTSALPGRHARRAGAVQNVRIGLNREESPLRHRVAVELSRRSSYHLEPSPDGQTLTMRRR